MLERKWFCYIPYSQPAFTPELSVLSCGWSLIYSALDKTRQLKRVALLFLLFLPLVFDANFWRDWPYSRERLFQGHLSFLMLALVYGTTIGRYLTMTGPLCYISFVTQKTICRKLLDAWTTLLLGSSLSSLSLLSSFTYKGKRSAGCSSSYAHLCNSCVAHRDLPHFSPPTPQLSIHPPYIILIPSLLLNRYPNRLPSSVTC